MLEGIVPRLTVKPFMGNLATLEKCWGPESTLIQTWIWRLNLTSHIGTVDTFAEVSNCVIILGMTMVVLASS